MRIFCTILTRMIVLQSRDWLGEERQVLDTDRGTGESLPSDQTLDTGFLSAVMSVGLNCVYRAPILKFNPITPKTISRV